MESEMERNKDIIEISSKLITLMDEHGGEYFLVEISYGPIPQQKGAEFVQKCMLETLKRHLGQVSREIVERALSTCPPILHEGAEKKAEND
jgi:hypothetical protein